MTFTAQVKTELCKSSLTSPCCLLAESYGLLLFAQQFSPRRIRLVTEHKGLIRRAPLLFEKALGLAPEQAVFQEKVAFFWEDPAAIQQIFTRFGYDYKQYVSYPIHRNLMESDCCKAAFLRGVFLSSGTVAPPEKKAHFELTTPHQGLCRQLMALLLDLGFYPKLITRKGNGVVYFKDSNAITDLLTLIGATHGALALMEAKVEKELRNTVNRQVNCETANYSRTLDVAAHQIETIQRALTLASWQAFPDALHDTIRLRLTHERMSLAELAQHSDPPMSKPGLSHRLKKIMTIAEQIIAQHTQEDN